MSVAVEPAWVPPGAALFFEAFFAAAFGAAFLVEGLLLSARGDAAFRMDFFATEAGFFAAGFAAFLAETVLTGDFFFATVRLTASLGAIAPLFPTRKASRFVAPAIQPGARPNPDQVAPVLGSWYFAAPLPARLAVARRLPTMAFLTADAFRDTVEDRCSSVIPSSSIRERTLPTDALVSSSARRAALASRAAICFLILINVSLAMFPEEDVGGPIVYPS